MTLCPHLGLPTDPTTALRYPSVGNRCHCNGLPRPLTVHQQEAYCLSPAHASCPLSQPDAILPARGAPSPAGSHNPGPHPHLAVPPSSQTKDATPTHLLGGPPSRVLRGARSRVLGAKGQALTILLPLGAVIGALLWWMITA